MFNALHLFLFLVLLIHVTLIWCVPNNKAQAEMSLNGKGNTAGNQIVKIRKHISEWISQSNSTVNCDGSTESMNCFKDWYKSAVYFYLFNRGRNGSELLNLWDENQLNKSSFKRASPLKVIIHGYKMNGFSHFSYLIKEAYLEHGNESNVLVVDWQWLASDHIYFTAAFNTRIAGERIGEFLVYLRKTRFIRSYKSVHLIGFSLGAHVAGFAAKHVMKTAKEKVGRITGLDPAGPSFAGVEPLDRLDSSDALFVDIIHTCVGRSGIEESIGHVDFFPNGGVDQPGCSWEKYNSFFLRNCSHERAYQFFLASIRGEKFVGCQCLNWEDFMTKVCRCNETTPGAELMGENCSFQATGNKYLEITHDNHYISL